MAAVVCHGLQTCLESQILESRTITLRFPPSEPLISQPKELSFKSCFMDLITKDHYEGNPLRRESITTCRGFKDPSEKDKIYVHPLEKRSSSLLSEKSLQLCTENLGSETGTDITEENIIDSFSSTGGNFPTRKKETEYLGGKNAKPGKNFPPPLTTIRGSENLSVRAQREDGRLVIKAIKVPSSGSCFQAERSNGRLRLCLLKNCTPSFDSEGDGIDEKEGIFEEFEKEHESEINGQRQEEREEEEEEEEEDSEEEQEYEDVGDEGQNCNNEIEMGMEKYEFERPRRCNEGTEKEKNGYLNWELLWVVTS